MIAWFLLLCTSTVCHVHISAQEGDICIHTQRTYVCSLSAVSNIYSISVRFRLFLLLDLSFIFGRFYLDVFIFYNQNKCDCLMRADFDTAQETTFSGCNKGCRLSQVNSTKHNNCNWINYTWIKWEQILFNITISAVAIIVMKWVAFPAIVKFTLKPSSKPVEKSVFALLLTSVLYLKLSCLVEIKLF